MVHFIPLSENLIFSFTDFLINKYRDDFTETTIIFPTRRIQFFLLGRLADKFKRDFIPPDTCTVDDFFEKSFKVIHPGFTKLTEPEACYIIYTILKDYSLDFINRDTGFLANFPWLLKILSAIESLLTEATILKPPLGQYKNFVRLGNYSKEYQQLIELLPEITEEFVKSTIKNNKYSRGVAYRIVAETAEKKDIYLSKTAYYFLGFHSLNYCEKTLFRYIFKNHESHIFFYTDYKAIENETAPFYLQQKTLKELGIQAEVPYSPQEKWNSFLNKVEIHEIPDTETEVAIAADTFVKETGRKSASEYIKTALILPDASSLIPLIHGLVSKTDSIPFNISLQYPFNRTALFKLIDNILNIVENRNGSSYRSQDYLNIIRHPYIKLLDETESELLKSGIHIIENSILKSNVFEIQIPEIMENLKKEAGRLPDNEIEEILKLVENIHSKFIFSGDLQFKEILGFLNNALKEVSRIRNNYLFLNEYLVFAFETVEEISKTAEKVDIETNLKIHDAADFIRYYFSQKQVPFEGSPLRGVQILGMLETRGLKFNEVYIFDNVEDILPQNRKYDPLLPYDIKKIFGLKNYIEWEKLFAYNFYSLIGSAEHVHLFYPASKDGQNTSRSRYIEYILYTMEEQAGKEVEVPTINTPFNLHSRKINNIEKDSSVIEKCKAMTFSPSSIVEYLTCPKKFYYHNILKIAEPEELQKEIAPKIQGSIIHAVLKNILSLWESNSASNDELLGTNLINSVEDQFRANGFNPETGINKLRAWGITQQLKKFLNSEFKRLTAEKTKIYELEHNLRLEISFDNKTFSLYGRADRIDIKPRGYRIIDYKTGASFTVEIKEENRRIFTKTLERRLHIDIHHLKTVQEFYNTFLEVFPSFQLLLYNIIFSNEINLPAHKIEGEYIFVQATDPNKWRKDVFADTSPEIRKEVIENLLEGLKIILTDIVSPEIPFYAVPDIKTCKNCSYTFICKK